MSIVDNAKAKAKEETKEFAEKSPLNRIIAVFVLCLIAGGLYLAGQDDEAKEVQEFTKEITITTTTSTESTAPDAVSVTSPAE